MKKKGLIVATIVMVLVLAVSLTTATYAWFTTTAQTTIDSINIKAASGTDIKIGMSKSNAYNATPNADHFVSGQVSIASRSGDTCVWEGDAGLGVELVTGLTLNEIAKATGYGTLPTFTYTEIPGATAADNVAPNYWSNDGSSYTPCPVTPVPGDGTYYTRSVQVDTGTAAKFVPGTSNGGQIVMASAKDGSDDHDPASVEAAVINTHYLHFTIGLAPSVENIDSIALNLFVNPTGSKTTIGVEASLYFYYNVNDTGWVAKQVYGDTYKQSTLRTSISTASTIGAVLTDEYSQSYDDKTALNDGYAFIPIVVDATGASFAVDEITQIEFYIFYDGTDADCVNAALGSECEVLFYITNTTVGA